MEEKKEKVIIAGYTKKMIGKKERNVFIIRNSRENSCTEAREDAFIFLDADGENICYYFHIGTRLSPSPFELN